MAKLAKEELELLEKSGYSKKVIEYYENRVNVGTIEDADATLAYTGPCGDTIKLYLKINQNGTIEDAKFQYLGCPGAASSGSALTQLVKGKTLEKAKKITEEDILKDLEGLPKLKHDCPKLALITLRKTIEDYERKVI